MGYKLKKAVAGAKSFRFLLNGRLTKYEVRTITEKQLKVLHEAGCDFVVSDSKKIVKNKKNDEAKKDNGTDD
tara:strand:- start:901 stop:1116 length:216 start_codon:yes stop_codon:yes gene_type:complete